MNQKLLIHTSINYKESNVFCKVNTYLNFFHVLRPLFDNNNQSSCESLHYTDLFSDVGSCLATPNSSARKSHIDKVPSLSSRHTAELEEWIDEYTKNLPPLENFILPGGGKTSASLHIARAVCRRAERSVQPLVDMGEVDSEVLGYIVNLYE